MAKRGVQIFCESCGYCYIVQLPGEVPAICNGCQSDHPTWRTSSDPRVPYELNFQDKRFLRSIRVCASE